MDKLWSVRLWGQTITKPTESKNPPKEQMLEPIQKPKSSLET